MNTQAVTEQAAQQQPSVEERAAAIFGSPKLKAAPAAPDAPEPTETEEGAPPEAELTEGNTEAATGETDAPTAEETFEFELDGEKWALPKKLEKAIQNNRDYTQKTQELANQRRLVEVANEQAKAMQLTREFEARVAPEVRKLNAYDEVLAQQIDPNQPQDVLLQQMVQRTQWEKERNALAQSINAKHQQYMQGYEKAMGELKAKAAEAVTKRIPGWNEAMWTSIREHAKSDGYTDAELGSISDPRHQITLWKAQQFDALKAKAVKTVPETKTLKTSPSSRPMPQAVRNKLEFRKQLNKTQPGSSERRKVVESRAAEIFSR